MKTFDEAYWREETRKVLSSDPEKYCSYHALLLRNIYNKGALNALIWARDQIVPDGNPCVAQAKIQVRIEELINNKA